MADLSEFSYSYQNKLLCSLRYDRKFFIQVWDLLNPRAFSNDGNFWISKKLKDYFEEYKEIPTNDVLLSELLKEKDSVIVELVKRSIEESDSFVDSKDLEYIKNNSINFFKQHALKKAFLDSVKDLESNNFDKVKERVDSVLKLGLSGDLGIIYKKDLDDRLDSKKRNPIPTPWNCINQITAGGLSYGELGVIMAPPGLGKSWMLVAIGANLVKLGYKVVHYSLELNSSYLGLRYDSYITGLTIRDIYRDRDSVKQFLSNLKGESIIKSYPTKTVSGLTLRSHLDQCRTILNYVPDVIIVDYGDLMKGKSFVEKRFELENIYEELRQISSEYQCPLWTVTQAGRSSLSDEYIGSDKISEAFKKVEIADFIMSVSTQKKILVNKNRFGPSFNTFNSIEFNTEIGTIKFEGDEENKQEIIFKGKEINSKKEDIYNPLLKELNQVQTGAYNISSDILKGRETFTF